MLIRKADMCDLDDVFEWRNDPISRSMFFDEAVVSTNEHEAWYKRSLVSDSINLFIGEEDTSKIGVCRFDMSLDQSNAEVSINLNPSNRGKGLSRKLLMSAIKHYRKSNKIDLLARIKRKNLPSIKIFESVGFVKTNVTKMEFFFCMPNKKLTFKTVRKTNTEDRSLLYSFLGKRGHNISHKVMPSIAKHNTFVQSHPYLQWYIICEEEPIGSFYIQTDNSVGLNLLYVRNEWISQTINYINENFTPRMPVQSKVPPYFFLNTPFGHDEMVTALAQLDLKPLQLSYKIN